MERISFYSKNAEQRKVEPVTKAMLTCPVCGFRQEAETSVENATELFHGIQLEDEGVGKTVMSSGPPLKTKRNPIVRSDHHLV